MAACSVRSLWLCWAARALMEAAVSSGVGGASAAKVGTAAPRLSKRLHARPVPHPWMVRVVGGTA